MFGLAEKSNFHDNLTDSIKAVINSHRVLPVRTSLLTSFLSNDVEGSVLTSFFGADLIDRVLNGLSIMLIGVDDDAEGRITFSYYHKNYDHFINHLLSLMNLILKLSEDIDMLHR